MIVIVGKQYAKARQIMLISQILLKKKT